MPTAKFQVLMLGVVQILLLAVAGRSPRKADAGVGCCE